MNGTITEQSSGTYEYFVEDFSNADYIARIRESSYSSDEYDVIAIAETGPFFRSMAIPFFENYVLKYSLSNLWRAHQYNQEYISYLLNMCTKEEFLEKAKAFADEFAEIDCERLTFASRIILETLEQPLDSADLSTLLNVDPKDIDNECSTLIEYYPEMTESKDDE